MSTPEPAPALLSRRWILSESDPGAAGALAREAGLPLLIAELLVARGVRTAAEAERFLHPQFEHLHDPYSMLGMERAVARIQKAIAARETILIYGDYDVDGTTAVVLLKTAIEMLGGVARFHVPHRLREGYGMQGEVLEAFARDGVRLVISVDTGIRAFAAAEAAETLGLDLIVTDHHLPEAAMGLPKALAILNPNQAECGYACKHLCGAGVVFKLAQALLEGWDRGAGAGEDSAVVSENGGDCDGRGCGSAAGREPRDCGDWPGAAATAGAAGTAVADGSRAARSGATEAESRRCGVSHCAADQCGRAHGCGDGGDRALHDEGCEARAGNRGQARSAESGASRRRGSDAEGDCRAAGEKSSFVKARCIVMDGDGWHRGVIGILASRIVDRTGKPAIVIAHGAHENGNGSADGTAHGSGRSISGFHLLDAIESCRDLFTRFGGHAHAVGFSLPSERVEELRERLCRYAAERLSEEDLGSPLECDAVLPLDRVTPAVLSWLRRLEPMGMGNAEPVFLAQNVRVAGAPRYMKEKHVRLQLAQGAHGEICGAGLELG